MSICAAVVSRELWDRVQAQLTRNHQGRRKGLKANAPSLLVGILEDAKGNRLTPSHTLKNTRRYRYYVCQARSKEGEASPPARLPAHDVERQLALRLQSFLQSARDVMDELSQPDDPPARTQQILAVASKQCEQLSSGSPAVVQDFVRKVVRHVVVHPDRIEIEVGKQELCATLTAEPHGSSLRPTAQQLEPKISGDVIRLAFEARFKRCGGKMRLVLPPDCLGQEPSHPASSLLKALARGRTWHEWILAGEVSGQRALAQKLGVITLSVGCQKCEYNLYGVIRQNILRTTPIHPARLLLKYRHYTH